MVPPKRQTPYSGCRQRSDQAKRDFHQQPERGEQPWPVPRRSIDPLRQPFSPKSLLMVPCLLPTPRHPPRFVAPQFGVDGDADADADLETTGARFADMSFGVSPQASGHASPIKPIPAPSKGRAGAAFRTQGITGGGSGGAASAAPSNGTGGKKPASSRAARAAAAALDKETAVALEVLEERLSAERAFGSMDQNSGRVSARRLVELLTLLGTSAERSTDATESARAAGLLSSPSFTRQAFVSW